MTDHDGAKRRTQLKQADVPAHDIEEALRIPIALRDQYGKQPTRPLAVAAAMNISPKSSALRMLSGAAVAYGLIEGGAQADLISLTDLGRRIVAPTAEGDELAAKREAVQRPRIVREFFNRYDGNRLPAPHIAANVLEEMGVPGDKAERAFQMIVDNAKAVGFLREVKGFQYVELTASAAVAPAPVGPIPRPDDPITTDEDLGQSPDAESSGDGAAGAVIGSAPQAVSDLSRNKRVFITHGRNKEIVGQLKEVLTFGGFEPIVSVERETTATPVPDKVINDMRSCAAGIVHVGTDRTVLDQNGTEHKMLNPNVLIEIGAALALYGRQFILLVEKGTEMPSNLQGLYEVRYEGDKLDYEATMKLLRAFNDFRSQG